jgi:alkylation response protein AidB-like acyl-CoA dehydrogenase
MQGQSHELVEKARALRPLIEAEAAQTERSGALSAPLLAALHEARLFRMLLPRSVGGFELPPADFIDVLVQLAAADASTAWMIAQGCGCSLSAAYLDPETAREIFGPPDAVMAWGPYDSGARAVAVEGGFRVTGRWSFASGNRQATWMGAHCTIHEADGRPRLDAAGKPVERTLILPRGEATFERDWNVVGLRGTGSDTYSAEAVFVPQRRSYRRESLQERREHGPLYQFTGMNIFAFGVAAMSLGIARALLDHFLAMARTKTDRVTGSPLRESGAVQAEVARAEAKLASSRLLMLATARELHHTAAAGEAFSLDQRARMRLSAVWAATQAREVADYAYTTAGAPAIFESAPFERRFRDMHTLTQQVQAQAANFELVGQAMLGVPFTSRLI